MMPFLAFTVVYLLWFNLLEEVPVWKCHDVGISFDDAIPFCAYFVIPYFAWFGFVPVIVVLTLMRSEEDYPRLQAELIAGELIFLIVNTLYPTCLHLRPEILPDNVFGTIAGWLYRTDTATDVLPSIHVYNTLAVMAAVRRGGDRVIRTRQGRRFCSILSVLIILSTMFLKQHSVMDVAAAFLMYGVVTMLAPGYVRRKSGAAASVSDR